MEEEEEGNSLIDVDMEEKLLGDGVEGNHVEEAHHLVALQQRRRG